MKSPAAPKTLSTEARRWWRQLMGEYDLADPAGRLLLETALQAFDRMRQAQAALETAGGVVIKDRFGQGKAHPAIAVERDARTQMMAALKQLNLDLEPLRDGPGRPPGT